MPEPNNQVSMQITGRTSGAVTLDFDKEDVAALVRTLRGQIDFEEIVVGLLDSPKFQRVVAVALIRALQMDEVSPRVAGALLEAIEGLAKDTPST